MIATLFALLALTNLADHASTVYFLKHTTLTEANPVLRKVIERFGLTGLFFTKASVLGVIGLIHYIQPLPWQVLAGMCVMYVLVVIWNITQVVKAKA